MKTGTQTHSVRTTTFSRTLQRLADRTLTEPPKKYSRARPLWTAAQLAEFRDAYARAKPKGEWIKQKAIELNWSVSYLLEVARGYRPKRFIK